MHLTVLFLLTAFVAGFAMKRAGTCTYVAAIQIVQQGNPRMLLFLLGTSAWAALFVLPSHWVVPEIISLTGGHYQWWNIVIGGLLLGVGSFLNRGCFFGTFVQLVGGNLNYVGTLLGISAGVVICHLFFQDYHPWINIVSSLQQPSTTIWIGLSLIAFFALGIALGISFNKTNHRVQLQPNLNTVLFMPLIGIGGGFLFASVGNWDYASVLPKVTLKLLDQQENWPTLLSVLTTIAMVCGGIVAGIVSSRIRLRWPVPSTFIKCFFGGSLMGGAALMVPGGNDGILLIGLPSLAIQAVVAFLLMLFVMLMLSYFLHRSDNESLGALTRNHKREVNHG